MKIQSESSRALPGYYTQKELLAALDMSRQNFHDTGLAAAIRPARQIGRLALYDERTVHQWFDWLDYRRAMIAMQVWPANTRVVPEGGRVPWYIPTAEYVWTCPNCGGTAYSPPGDPARVWCPKDGELPSTD